MGSRPDARLAYGRYHAVLRRARAPCSSFAAAGELMRNEVPGGANGGHRETIHRMRVSDAATTPPLPAARRVSAPDERPITGSGERYQRKKVDRSEFALLDPDRMKCHDAPPADRDYLHAAAEYSRVLVAGVRRY